MTPFSVRKAKRQRRPLKVSLEGLSGSGKTFTALRLAFQMRRAGIGSRIAVADSENNSADLYAGVVIDGDRWDYEVCELPPDARHPVGYTAAYDYLVRQGFDIVVMDSLSHAWHGAMERIDQLAARLKGDKHRAWATVTPEQREFIQALTDPRAHLIATMRVKGEYERVEENGRNKIKKVGLKTDQRDGTEYEFDAVVRMEPGTHLATVEKVRGCSEMDGRSATAPGVEFWRPLLDWWLTADPVVPLAETLAHAIRSAATLDALKAAFGQSYHAHAAGRITDAEHADHVRIKDEQKAAIRAADRAAEVAAAVPGLTTGDKVPQPGRKPDPAPAAK